MQLATTIASTSFVLGVVLCAGYAQGEQSGAGSTAGVQTWQAKLEAREAQRRVALEDHKKRKEDFNKRCASSQPMTAAQLEVCKAAYRKL